MNKKQNDSLQAEYRNLSNDAKKKYSQIKEAAEISIVKLRECQNLESSNEHIYLDLLQPFVLACETKQTNLILSSLLGMQKLLNYNLVNKETSTMMVKIMMNLVKNGTEEIRILQTTILLLTSNTLVQNNILANSLVSCFLIYSQKMPQDAHAKEKDNATIVSTAAATIRQLVSVVLERVTLKNMESTLNGHEDQTNQFENDSAIQMGPALSDAYRLFQDLCLLAHGDKTEWLKEMPVVPRTFALELVETILDKFNHTFTSEPQFFKLVKDKVCPLVIKLFSPNVKYDQNESTLMATAGVAGHGAPSVSGQSNAPSDRTLFPINLRLLRLVGTLVKHFYQHLVMECEIFLSMLIKFIDPEKPDWLRVLTLETLNKIVVHPAILGAVCKNYDMNPNSSKIFSMLVEALDNGIQSKFSSNNKGQETSRSKLTNNSQAPASNHQNNTGSATMQQSQTSNLSSTPSISFQGTTMSLAFAIHPRHCKIVYLELLDKMEAPNIPESSSFTLLLADLVDLIITLGQIINPSESNLDPSDITATLQTDPKSSQLYDIDLWETLIELSWCNVLSSLNTILVMSESEILNETVTKNMQYYAYLCGLLRLKAQRNAFVTSLCKESLPAQYPHAQSLLCPSPNDKIDELSSASIQAQNLPSGENVPAPNPTSLTPKNIHCMRALLNLIHCYGTVLEGVWDTILPTLLHLVWLLGLKPASYHGSNYKVIGNDHPNEKAQQNADRVNPGIKVVLIPNQEIESSPANQSGRNNDITVIQNMLLRLFETTNTFTDIQLLDLLHSLVKLSTQMLQFKANTPDSGLALLFPLAKISEICHVNLARLGVYWDAIVHQHLGRTLVLEERQTNNVIREFAGTIICSLVKHGVENFVFFHDVSPAEREPGLVKLYPSAVLAPMLEIISKGSKYPEARLAQLNTLHGLLRDRSRSIIFTNTPNEQENDENICLSQLIQTLGCVPSLSETGENSWLVKGDDKSDISTSANNSLAVAFQCLQLLINDFLLYFSPSNIEQCIGVVHKFAAQNDHLNISLTSIGLLWNISDFLHQNKPKAMITPENKETGEETSAGNFPDVIWMCLYTKMAALCLDSRSPVRKSACQTLFSTVDAHGTLMNAHSWQTFIWEALFPLLNQIRMNTIIAPKNKESSGGDKQDILIHHSRDTQAKQWAETQVLAFEGIARIFCNQTTYPLQQMDDFVNMWTWLLQYIQKCALSPSGEICTAALKCLREFIDVNLSQTARSQLECVQSLWLTLLDICATLSERAQVRLATRKEKEDSPEEIQMDGSIISGSQKYSALATCIQLVPLALNRISLYCLDPYNQNIAQAMLKLIFRFHDEEGEGLLPPFASSFDRIVQTPVPKEVIVPYASSHNTWKNNNKSTVPCKDAHSYNPQETSITLNSCFPALELTPVQDGVFMSCFEICRLVESLATAKDRDMEVSFVVGRAQASLIKTMLRFAGFMWRNPESIKNLSKRSESGILYFDYTSTLIQSPNSLNCRWVLPVLENFGSKCARLLGATYVSCNEKAKLDLCMPIIKFVEEGIEYKQSLGKHYCNLLWETMHLIFLSCLPLLKTIGGDKIRESNIYEALLSLLQKYLFSQQTLVTTPPPCQGLPLVKSTKAVDMYGELEVKTITHIICRHVLELDLSGGGGAGGSSFKSDDGDISKLPHPFLTGIMNILAKGSTYTQLPSTNNSASYFKPDSSVPLVKDRFMAVCFDTICRLALSSSNNKVVTSMKGGSSCGGVVPSECIALAISLLLTRCQCVLKDYLKDEDVWGKCPLPRMRLLEITSSLTALTKLLAFIKQNDLPGDCVNENIWQQITDLYTVLVDCMLSNSRQICSYLQTALRQYSGFMLAPAAFKTSTSKKKSIIPNSSPIL